MNLRLEANAKSRTFFALKRQVLVVVARVFSLGFGFGLGHDDHRLGAVRACFRRSRWAALSTVARILQLAGGGHDVVGRDRELDVVVAEFQREFAGAQELLVLPAVGVVVGRHAREPLGDLEQVVLVFVELLVAQRPPSTFARML
jgi:hypothetical protein